ncbi:hypothetical protein GW17_00058160, partial [Ensete ventricosum]
AARPPLSNRSKRRRPLLLLCLSFSPTVAVAAYYCSRHQHLSTRHRYPSIPCCRSRFQPCPSSLSLLAAPIAPPCCPCYTSLLPLLPLLTPYPVAAATAAPLHLPPLFLPATTADHPLPPLLPIAATIINSILAPHPPCFLFSTNSYNSPQPYPTPFFLYCPTSIVTVAAAPFIIFILQPPSPTSCCCHLACCSCHPIVASVVTTTHADTCTLLCSNRCPSLSSPPTLLEDKADLKWVASYLGSRETPKGEGRGATEEEIKVAVLKRSASAVGGFATTHLDKVKGLAEVEDVPDHGYSLWELCEVDDQARAD